MPVSHSFFASVPKGVETLLVDELQSLGAAQLQPTRAGVAFTGPLEMGYRVCLWSRLASRVLLVLDQFPAPTTQALYQGVRALPWQEHMAPDGSLAVHLVAAQSHLTHTHFGALKVKDAIVDQLRDEFGVRPNVDLQRPHVRIHVYLFRDHARISLDLAGASLHQRGYRLGGHRAPLKENLAAALLLKAGWPAVARDRGPFIDPMCGTGTLPIEAALLAADCAPGARRDYFGFTHWRGHHQETWARLQDEARQRRRAGLERLPVVVGYDADAAAVRTGLACVERAGLQGKVHIEKRGFAAVRPPKRRGNDVPGLVLANPPYGLRLGDKASLVDLYARLGTQLKTHFATWRAGVLTADTDLRLGLKPHRTYTLYNGAVPCQLSVFIMGSGASPPSSQAAPAEEARPPGQQGPARQKPQAQVAGGQQSAAPALDSGAEMLANRLRKNRRQLVRWARKNQVDCYRLYDADLPEYALAVDLYQGAEDQPWVHIQEYRPPASIDPERAAQRRRQALLAIPQALEIGPQRCFFKLRQRQKGKAQYEKLGTDGSFHLVREGEASFLVNFTDYLDTGLFLDHRLTRARLKEWARGGDFLNLFGYTGTASVQAGLGGARSSVTVDMSRVYLDWARRNLALNKLDLGSHQLVQADCLEWLKGARGRYSLIFLDPPTFSNSKRMDTTFDVQRDHLDLIARTARLLAPGGVLLFSTNARRFKPDLQGLEGLVAEDLSAATLPPDFARKPRIHRCWKITRSDSS